MPRPRMRRCDLRSATRSALRALGQGGARQLVLRGASARPGRTPRAAPARRVRYRRAGPLRGRRRDRRRSGQWAGCRDTRWLRCWLEMQQGLRPSTREGYADHIRLHLIPYPGRIELAQLTARTGARRAGPGVGAAWTVSASDLLAVTPRRIIHPSRTYSRKRDRARDGHRVTA
ncbi:hypothetical protein FE391_05955 [Nonomuraea sp. KC401]|uniref:hypothetical protein n=1 Tax=Nonomuraea sp. K271 TaxID=1848319 RepID=UPI0010FF1A2D|nr:hypothetical protein FE391_05955 [Nonomuraea sp. KC401]